MELGAVVVVPAKEDLTAMSLAPIDLAQTKPHVVSASENSRPFYSSRMPILGNDVLHSWMERVRKLGVQSLWLTAESPRRRHASSALAEFARQGVERLLVIKLKSYAEMDLADLLRFHCEKPKSGDRGPRCARSVGSLPAGSSRVASNSGERNMFRFSCRRASIPANSGRSPYQFRGYAKRILSARERQELVGDGLTGACAMRPLGTEIREQVWIGEGVNLADSVRLIGPTYIGARTMVRAGATIGPFASVEHDCVVDCGTTVERSTVLPHTYLAPGLLIRHQTGGRRISGRSGMGDCCRSAASRAWEEEFSGVNRANQHSARPMLSPRADSAFSWELAPSSSRSQPWLQVQL